MQPIVLLYIEDDPSIAQLFTYALERVQFGAIAFIVGDCKHALGFLHREAPYQDAPVPDLLVLDIDLPLMSGFETLQAIRTDPGLPNFPALFFSSSQSKADRDRASSLGALNLIHKPLNLADFEEAVRHICTFAATAGDR